jgi:hypothetical protein
MTMTYRISQHDVGANGGICGDDMLVLEGSERFVGVCIWVGGPQM